MLGPSYCSIENAAAPEKWFFKTNNLSNNRSVKSSHFQSKSFSLESKKDFLQKNYFSREKIHKTPQTNSY